VSSTVVAALEDAREQTLAADSARIEFRVEWTWGGIAAPARTRFEDLLALPVEVWIEDTQIRRIRFSFEGIEQHTDTLELWDFGVSLDDLDWTRLPTFRSPDEAAQRS